MIMMMNVFYMLRTAVVASLYATIVKLNYIAKYKEFVVLERKTVKSKGIVCTIEIVVQENNSCWEITLQTN